jgi:hypothetical protein
MLFNFKIFRHGDRTPVELMTYPKDPYNASFYEPYGFGQLTNVRILSMQSYLDKYLNAYKC